MEKENLKNIADFLFETGALANTYRSGFGRLGEKDHQTVAEHTNRTCFVGFCLASGSNADVNKVVKMCLFHDLAEARVSDLNYIHQLYVKKDEEKAVEDFTRDLPFGEDIKEIIAEFEKAESEEAKLARDADQIELLLSLKELMDDGNKATKDWIPSLLRRLKTENGKALAEEIIETDSNHWWFGKMKEGEWQKESN